jgi:hypothetical protein
MNTKGDKIMEQIDIISIWLGAISVGLAIYAVRQSWRYKNLDDKLDKDREQIINEIHENSIISLMIERNIDEKINSTPSILNLHKDELRVWINSKYKPNNMIEVIEKLKKELPNILKQTYIDSIIAALNTVDESAVEIAVVSLRYQYEKEDFHIIRELNDIFNKDGIYFELRIS